MMKNQKEATKKVAKSLAGNVTNPYGHVKYFTVSGSITSTVRKPPPYSS